MYIRTIKHLVCAALLSTISFTTSALSSSQFTHQSKLATGRWVKIAISETGVYEISKQELVQMGFSSPMNVKVYGRGGEMMPTLLSPSLPDDIQQIPAYRTNEKLCFYGIGPVNLKLVGGSSPHYTRERNTYSILSYYFLIEESGGKQPGVKSHISSPQLTHDTSLQALLHEQELFTAAFTGSELLGEDLMNANNQFDYTLINPSDSHICLTSRVAAKVTRSISNASYYVYSKFKCIAITGAQQVQVPYSSTASSIPSSLSEYIYYQTNKNHDDNAVWFDRKDSSPTGSLLYTVESTPADSSTIKLSRLDFFIITYNQYNNIQGHAGAQCQMGFTSTTGDEAVRVEGGKSLVVWDVTSPHSPIQMQTKPSTGNSVTFTPAQSSSPCQFVAFNPTSTLLKIKSYEMIDNQNLHGMHTPDMLIVSHSEFIPQAERIANLHRQEDGMDVAVIDQEQIFNEFSSGTPDAMAIRLLCKMLYDRNPIKFRYLLLMGNVSFDNRGIVTGKHNRLISYVSPVSYYEDGSYINNDFYGYLEDNSGINMAKEKLYLGVGHFPVANAHEATETVDKLYEYVYSTDYGHWRNNYALWAEKSKDGEGKITWNDTITSGGSTTVVTHTVNQLHESHSAGIGYILDHDLKTQMVRDMTFVSMFPRDPTQSYREEAKQLSLEGKKHILEMLDEGQYFITYCGHSGATSLTGSELWTSTDVDKYDYAHLPIITTASCDVARIDSDHRGIAEKMFHKRHGGAIALYTTTRQVYASLNDTTNRAFVRQLFTRQQNGKPTRLGDAYMASKNSQVNSNKFNFVLLGDPAMRVNYPKPLFRITKVNGVDVTNGRSVNVYPLQRVTIEAQVVNNTSSNSINTSFYGDATFTFYDTERVHIAQIAGTGSNANNRYPLMFPREKLAQVSGRVEKGVFKGSIVLPRNTRGTSGKLLLSAYAHQDGTTNMVNGLYDNAYKNSYNPSKAVSDTSNPIITAMYLNNQDEFAANATVGSDATLYIQATDNVSFNTQQVGFGRSMRLTMDGGQLSYHTIKNLTKVSDEGRKLTIAMPLTAMPPGNHTLEFMVQDACGNTATQSISFIVNEGNALSLATSEVASSSSVQIDLTSFLQNDVPTVNLKITDMDGNLVWKKQTASFPCIWNLTNTNGARVKAGLYHIYGTCSNDSNYGGSNMIDFVVLDPIQ